MVPMSPPALRLTGITLWRAPRLGRVSPWQVAPQQVWLELIVDGQVEPPEACEDQSLAGAGTLFWNVAGQWTVHRYPPHQPYVALALRFQVEDTVEPPPPRRSHWPDLVALQAFVSEVQRVRQEDRWRDPAFAAYTYHRLAWIARESRQRPADSHPVALQRALGLIARTPEGDLRLTRLAAEAGVSVSCLCEQFQRHLGTTPHEYVVHHRIERARMLLTDSGLLIKEVAAATGFATASLFCRTFRRLTGTSPQTFRERGGA